MSEVINLLVGDDEVAPLTPAQIQDVIKGETVCYYRGYSDDIRIYFRNFDTVYEYSLPKKEMFQQAHIIGKVEKCYEI